MDTKMLSEEASSSDLDADSSTESSSDSDSSSGLDSSEGSDSSSEKASAGMGPAHPSILRSRLQEFLPQLRAANENIDPNNASLEIAEVEHVDRSRDLSSSDSQIRFKHDEMVTEDNGDGEGTAQPYIELNLGLGVLEQKDPDSAEDEASDAAMAGLTHGLGKKRANCEGNEADTLGRLMGKRRKLGPDAIKEVGTGLETSPA